MLVNTTDVVRSVHIPKIGESSNFVPEPTNRPSARTRRVAGLDSIRFVCALIVLLFHLGLTQTPLRGQAFGLWPKIGTGLLNCLFNGPAAVIVFFLLSGFCIHYPYRNGRPLAIPSFYIRRFTRILLPSLVFLVILRWVIHDDIRLNETVLWSIICEAVYYATYPILLILRRRTNWPLLIGAAIAAATGVIITHLSWLPRGLWSYAALGWYTCIIGLPCWLGGCWLAEVHPRLQPPSRTRMWSARAALFGFAVGLQLIRFHTHAIYSSNCLLLDLFAVPAWLWLGWEIAYASQHAPSRILEWAGGWSFSLYLVHPLVAPCMTQFGLSIPAGHLWTHPLLLVIILAVSYAFFRCVESPFHRLAMAAAGARSSRPVLAT